MEITSKKLSSLEEKIDQLKAQHAKEAARLKAQAKKDDTRRKILVGAYFLEKAQEEGSMENLIKQIDPFLKRKADRDLFGFKNSHENTSDENN